MYTEKLIKHAFYKPTFSAKSQIIKTKHQGTSKHVFYNFKIVIKQSCQ